MAEALYVRREIEAAGCTWRFTDHALARYAERFPDRAGLQHELGAARRAGRSVLRHIRRSCRVNGKRPANRYAYFVTKGSPRIVLVCQVLGVADYLVVTCWGLKTPRE